MTMQVTIALGVSMAVIALINTALMAWLWRFPMKPDPSGRDPHGVSTAPRFATNVHRVLGYVFAFAYAMLLYEMVPRTWEFRVTTAWGVVHGVLGIVVGILLVTKIAIIRRFRRFGNRLPWIGGTLALCTLVVAVFGILPAWKLMRPYVPISGDLARGRDVVSARCSQCHGASIITAEREDARKWTRITREMQRFSRTIPGKVAITDGERALAAFLSRVRAR